jgi:hypothetical protein
LLRGLKDFFNYCQSQGVFRFAFIQTDLTAPAQARGVVFSRRLGQPVKSDKLAPKLLALGAAGLVNPADRSAGN